ncbi:MAG: DoxX family protein [Methylococcaceae bacterium]|jgi:uncharacterized membrane protein YphA (DoxX/SURF4 family)
MNFNLKTLDYRALIQKLIVYYHLTHTGLDKLKCLDFIAPLLIRLYLIPVLWMAGTQKLMDFSGTMAWFGNSDWGLGLPLPWLMVFLVVFFELVGAMCLLLGFCVRLICIPLMFIMLMAAYTVHWQNGWLAIAGADSVFATNRTTEAVQRLMQAKNLLQQYGNYDWLTEYGNFVVLNNGIEFAATYFIMLLSLLFMGAGRYVSVDYWLTKNTLNLKG